MLPCSFQRPLRRPALCSIWMRIAQSKMMRRNHCQLLSTTTGGTWGGGDDANTTVHLCVRGDEMSPLILSLFFFFFFFTKKQKCVGLCEWAGAWMHAHKSHANPKAVPRKAISGAAGWRSCRSLHPLPSPPRLMWPILLLSWMKRDGGRQRWRRLDQPVGSGRVKQQQQQQEEKGINLFSVRALI